MLTASASISRKPEESQEHCLINSLTVQLLHRSCPIMIPALMGAKLMRITECWDHHEGRSSDAPGNK